MATKIQKKTTIKPQSKPKPQAKAKPKAKPKTKPAVKAPVKSKGAAKPKIQPKTKPKAQVKAKPKPKTALKAKPAVKPTKVKAKVAPKVKPQVKAKPKTALKVKDMAKPKPKPVVGAEVKPAEKAETVAEPVQIERRVVISAASQERNEKLRKLLIQKREDIVRESKNEIKKYVAGEKKQLVETVMDDGDLSVVDLAEDISLKQLSTHRETLLKIDHALRKFDEGTYGTCDECGDEISVERLMIMPFAIFCRDCQEEREMRDKIEKEDGAL